MALSDRCRSALGALLSIGILSGACAAAAAADSGMRGHGDHDLVFFVSGEAHHFTAEGSQNQLNEDAWASADIVLAMTRGKFRLFGEYLLSSKEHDLERLQLGYEPLADTVLWLGRFHQPASAWNTEHHHGRYLQTAITRPAVELWEDEEGIIPQHLTGVLIDSHRPIGEVAGLHFALGAGLGARIEDEGLEPLELLNPHPQERRVSWTGRLAYLPSYVGATQLGLVLGRHDMPVIDVAIAQALRANRVAQSIFGAFGVWDDDPWRVTAVAYQVDMSLDGPAGTKNEDFLAGYLQAERQLPYNLTVYGRGESSSGAGQSTYIAVVQPDFVLRRATAGVRWDFISRQALTFEVNRGATLQVHRSEFRLQWSAALP